VGAQRTYVMHKDGMETMLLRPGFEGDVDEFGMLIPFPAPPAIRKIDDEIFAHIEAAVDPPELKVHIQERRVYQDMPSMARRSASMGAVPMEMAEEALAYDEVRVLNQEAVGMYQVAVLQAGSPKALSKWMEENGFRYPDGMDKVVEDYVEDRWCFVAVKAKVGSAKGAAPRPGMRSTNPNLPPDASFDGHVQGMGFRFPTEKPVIPMRLSVFNGEGPRNVIYMLADEPLALHGAPDGFVVRQVSGRDLLDNLTRPIPIHITGGRLEDLSSAEREKVSRKRDPDQYNGIARDLFSADLLAARHETLTLHFEEEEKALLNISESLNLRGDAIDGLLNDAVEEKRDRATDVALDDLRGMTLSIMDGVIPGDLIADENLRFEHHELAWRDNKPRTDVIKPQAGSLTFYR
jgi:hypothetical protein